VPRFTLSLPDHLHRKMKRHPEVRWSGVIRRILSEKIRDLDMMERIAARSLLRAEDVDELDHILKEALLRRYQCRREEQAAEAQPG